MLFYFILVILSFALKDVLTLILFPINNTHYTGNWQVPVIGFSQSVNPVHLIEVCEGAKSRLIRPIHLSHAYTPSTTASECPIFRQVLGEEIGSLLDALIGVSINEHKKGHTNSEIINVLSSSTYKGGSISTCIQLDKILTDWFHEHDEFLDADEEKQRRESQDHDLVAEAKEDSVPIQDTRALGSKSSSPSSSSLRSASKRGSHWMKMRQSIKFRTYNMEGTENEEEKRRDQKIKRRAAAFAVVLTVLSRYPLVSTAHTDRSSWTSDLLSTVCKSTRCNINYVEIARWMCTYIEAKTNEMKEMKETKDIMETQEKQNDPFSQRKILNRKLSNFMSKNFHIDLEVEQKKHNDMDIQTENFLSLSKWFGVFPINKSSMGVTIISVLVSYILDRDITLVDLSIVGKQFLQHSMELRCEPTSEKFGKDGHKASNNAHTHLRHVIKVHMKNWDEVSEDEGAKNISVDDSSPLLYIGGEGCLTMEIMTVLFCSGGYRLTKMQPSIIQRNITRIQKEISVNNNADNSDNREDNFFSLLWNDEELRHYIERISHLLRATMTLEGRSLTDDLWVKVILPTSSLAYMSKELPLKDMFKNMFSQLLCWSAASTGEESFFVLKFLLVLCYREDNQHAYSLAEETVMAMHTYIGDLQRDNGSGRSWKKCLNNIVRTVFILFPHNDMMVKRESQIVVPVMSQVSNRPTIHSVKDRSLFDVIQELISNKVTKDDIQPAEISETTGRYRRKDSHIIHGKWELARRLNSNKKEVMKWREDLSFAAPIFPPILLENLSWAEMVVIGK